MKPQRQKYLVSILRESDATYQVWEGFSLVRKANSGDPAAQHELGIRYLVGQGFTPDTARAFDLISLAAKKDYMLAHFNLGVFFSNGWGTEWDPFLAFRHFELSAQSGMPQGLYVLGLHYTDNLVVQQDWQKAGEFIKKAADKGFQPAVDLLPDIQKRLSGDATEGSVPDYSTISSSQSAYTPLFIDFSDKGTAKENNNEVLRDILRKLPFYAHVQDTAGISISELVRALEAHAEIGVPEEYSTLGRIYERGEGVRQDSIKAAVYYMRALREESYRAPRLLDRLLSVPGMKQNITQRAKNGESFSLYLLGCLSLFISDQFAVDLGIQSLRSSATNHYVPGLNEMGTLFLNGSYQDRNIDSAIYYFRLSIHQGSKSGLIRMAALRLFESFPDLSLDSARSTLIWGEKEGSLFAQSTLGSCYENGIGISKNMAKAVQYYRSAAQRGSRISYEHLKYLYDRKRPEDPMFQLRE